MAILDNGYVPSTRRDKEWFLQNQTEETHRIHTKVITPPAIDRVIMVWVICDVFGKEVPNMEFRYKDKAIAQTKVEELNKDKEKHFFYLQPKKK